MQYIPCNSALLAQEALFLPKKALFLPKDLKKKVRKSRQILIRNKIAYVRAWSFRQSLFGGGPRTTSATLWLLYFCMRNFQIPPWPPSKYFSIWANPLSGLSLLLNLKSCKSFPFHYFILQHQMIYCNNDVRLSQTPSLTNSEGQQDLP